MLKWILGVLIILAAGAAAAWWWLNRPLIIRHPDFGTDCSELVTGAGVGSKVDCVRVWYGTNRSLVTDETTLASDATDVSEALGESGDQLRLGRADIWLPKLVEQGGNRERGETPHVQGAAPQDPDKLSEYVFLTRITTSGRETFSTTLQQAITDNNEGAVLLFVHGFNVKFDDALVRAAQLSEDLSREDQYDVGTPVLFSWPSVGKLSLEDYQGDRARSLGAAPYLEAFLDILTEDLEVERINIIAHSMGNRVLTKALEDYARDYLVRHNRTDLEFRILLVAADVERDIFDQANGVFDNLDANVTIYTSDTDRALHISNFVNSNEQKRLGDTDKNRPYIRAAQNYATIDATAVATELFGVGHNYYSDNPTILWDMMCTIGETRPQDRALEVARFDDQPDGDQYYRVNADINPNAQACKLRRSAFPANMNVTAEPELAPVEVETMPEAKPGSRGLVLPPPPPSDASEVFDVQSAPLQTQFYVTDYTSLDLEPYETVLAQILADQDRIERIRIQAYHDTAASNFDSLNQTREFAEAVKAWFVERGIAAERIEANGWGETILAIETDDGVVEALNRRVEINLVYRD